MQIEEAKKKTCPLTKEFCLADECMWGVIRIYKKDNREIESFDCVVKEININIYALNYAVRAL